MLIGHDISKWNKGIDVNAGEFTLMKVTEGVTYQDPEAEGYVRQSNDEQLLGCYHFLRADNRTKGNTPTKEAVNFCNTVNKLGLLYKAILIVDYEAGSLGNEDYLIQTLQQIQNRTGVRPFVYCSSSTTKQLTKTAALGYPLWLAEYNKEKPTIYNFKEAKIWQVNSKPWDMDIFYGTRADWYRLANKA